VSGTGLSGLSSPGSVGGKWLHSRKLSLVEICKFGAISSINVRGFKTRKASLEMCTPNHHAYLQKV